MDEKLVTQIEEIIAGIKRGLPSNDLKGAHLFNSGILDSMDLINLVSALELNFNVVIEGEQITPENFATAESIARMVTTLKQNT